MSETQSPTNQGTPKAKPAHGQELNMQLELISSKKLWTRRDSAWSSYYKKVTIYGWQQEKKWMKTNGQF